MSTKEREPLFSDAAVDAPKIFDGRHIRDIYEEARAKDTELIQQLVDALASLRKSVNRAPFDTLMCSDRAMNSAASAGFTPTK